MNPVLLNRLKKSAKKHKGSKFKKFLLIHSPLLASIGMGLLVLLFFLAFILMLVGGSEDDDDDGCGSSNGPVTANFSIKPVGPNKKVSVAIEKWCAGKGLSAAQTSAILGSAMQESTMGNATSNLLGWSDPTGSVADHSHDTSNVSAYLDNFCKNIGNLGHNWASFNAFKRDTKSDNPEQCEKFWGTHIEVCADWGSRVGFAKQYYKTISGGSTTTASSDASSTASSGSDSCGGGSGDSTDVIKFAEKYMGLKYSQATRVQSIKDILANKPKSQTAENDCDGFVYAVLKHCGYKVPSSYWGNVAGMDSYYKHDEIPASQTHAGTPATYPPGAPDYGKLGHAFILMTKWHGPSTKIIGEGPQDVNIHSAEWVLTGGNLNDCHFYNVPKG